MERTFRKCSRRERARRFGATAAFLAALLLAPAVAAQQTVSGAAQAEAVAAFPEIGVSGSELNKRFVAAVAKARADNDPILQDAGWPLKIAYNVAPPSQQKAFREHKNAALQDALAKFPLTTMREMRSDLRGFIGKTVIVRGKIEVSDYYNYGYSGLSSVVFSYRFRDATGTGNLYDLREHAETRRQIIDAGGPLQGTFIIQIMPDIRHEEGEGVMAQLFKIIPPS